MKVFSFNSSLKEMLIQSGVESGNSLVTSMSFHRGESPSVGHTVYKEQKGESEWREKTEKNKKKI